MTDVMTRAELGTHAQFDPPGEGEEACAGQMRIIEKTEAVWMLECEECGWEVWQPARKADPSLRRRLRERQAGFPARFAGKPFQQDPLNRPAVKAVHGWLAQCGRWLPQRRAWERLRGEERRQREAPPCPRSPALYGGPGLGKSHLLVAVGERLIRDHDAGVLFRSIARLLDELQDAFDRPGEHGLIWQRALSVDVLALDDLGAERPTEWRTDRLARLVDERWERELPVLVATNYPPHMWDEAFDARTASRLRGMTYPVELGGADRRQLETEASGEAT